MNPELHIVGVLVHARPKALSRVAESIANIPRAKIHAVDAAGQIVVTLEAVTAIAIQEAIERTRRLPGVLMASLVYQHCESLETMNEEVSDENYAPGIH